MLNGGAVEVVIVPTVICGFGNSEESWNQGHCQVVGDETGVIAAMLSCAFARQCPAQLFIGLLLFCWSTWVQCSQWRGDIGAIGVIFISIASSCCGGISAAIAIAIGIMQKVPSKM